MRQKAAEKQHSTGFQLNRDSAGQIESIRHNLTVASMEMFERPAEMAAGYYVHTAVFAGRGVQCDPYPHYFFHRGVRKISIILMPGFLHSHVRRFAKCGILENYRYLIRAAIPPPRASTD